MTTMHHIGYWVAPWSSSSGRCTRSTPAILGMHPRLSGLAEGWDGSDPMRPMRPVTTP